MKAAAIFLRLLVFFPLRLNRWRMFVSLRRACNARSRNIPGAKVITESDLDADDRQFFQKDHHGACPGLIKVDFYGDGKPIFGLELITGSQAGPNIKLVIARQIGLNWNLLFLARTRRNAPVIWSDKPGDIKASGTISSMQPIVLSFGRVMSRGPSCMPGTGGKWSTSNSSTNLPREQVNLR